MHIVGPVAAAANPYPFAPAVNMGSLPARTTGVDSQQQSAMQVNGSWSQQATFSTRQQKQSRFRQPPTSPARSRMPSSRRSSMMVSLASRSEEEPPKRRVIVRLPAGAAHVAGPITKRRPLSQAVRQEIERRARDDHTSFVVLDDAEVVTRRPHFDETGTSTLPRSLDVYLPGLLAWQDVWDDIETRATPSEIYVRSPEFCPCRLPFDVLILATQRHRRRNDSHSRVTDSLPGALRDDFPRQHFGGHRRGDSFFSLASDLPPQLRNAVESLQGRITGHRTTASMLPSITAPRPVFADARPAARLAPTTPSLATTSQKDESQLRARSASCASSRTDATGVVSLSGNESAADKGVEELDDPVLANDGACSARLSPEIAIPYACYNNAQYGDKERTTSDGHNVPHYRAVSNISLPAELNQARPALTFGEPAHHRIASWPQDLRRLGYPIPLQQLAPRPESLATTAESEHRLTPHAASLPFGTHGQPDSLAASPASASGLSSPAFSPVWQLNALASNFVPTASQGRADSLAVTVANPPSPAVVLFSSQLSTGRRPLPPLPTASTCQHTRGQPQGAGGNRSLHPTIELVHPQPRRPLPTPPIPMSSPSLSEEVLELSRGGQYAPASAAPGDMVNRSSLSLDDPLPEQYKPPTSFLRGPMASATAGPAYGSSMPLADHRGAEWVTASPARAVEVSPARMGDPRALRDPTSPVGQPRSSYLRRFDSPSASHETFKSVPSSHTPPDLDALLADRLDLHKGTATRLAVVTLDQGYQFSEKLAAMIANQNDLAREMRDSVLGQQRELTALLRGLSRRLDAVSEDVSAATRSLLLEKVDLGAIMSALTPLQTMLRELHSLRGLLEQQRAPYTPSDDGLATSASTLVKSTDSVSLGGSSATKPRTPPLAHEITPDVGKEEASSLAERRLVHARLATLEESLASQVGLRILLGQPMSL